MDVGSHQLGSDGGFFVMKINALVFSVLFAPLWAFAKFEIPVTSVPVGSYSFVEERTVDSDSFLGGLFGMTSITQVLVLEGFEPLEEMKGQLLSAASGQSFDDKQQDFLIFFSSVLAEYERQMGIAANPRSAERPNLEFLEAASDFLYPHRTVLLYKRLDEFPSSWSNEYSRRREAFQNRLNSGARFVGGGIQFIGAGLSIVGFGLTIVGAVESFATGMLLANPYTMGLGMAREMTGVGSGSMLLGVGGIMSGGVVGAIGAEVSRLFSLDRPFSIPFEPMHFNYWRADAVTGLSAILIEADQLTELGKLVTDETPVEVRKFLSAKNLGHLMGLEVQLQKIIREVSALELDSDSKGLGLEIMSTLAYQNRNSQVLRNIVGTLESPEVLERLFQGIDSEEIRGNARIESQHFSIVFRAADKIALSLLDEQTVNPAAMVKTLTEVLGEAGDLANFKNDSEASLQALEARIAEMDADAIREVYARHNTLVSQLGVYIGQKRKASERFAGEMAEELAARSAQLAVDGTIFALKTTVKGGVSAIRSAGKLCGYLLNRGLPKPSSRPDEPDKK